MQDETRDTTIEDKKDNTFREINVLSSKSWVYCAGDTKFGHPRVFLDLLKTGVAICPYCSCRYIVKK
ncbi:MAG: hypothetical protein BGO76_07590 [Caedibacter sp. 38-128]|nr:zinc-finger domain-containing protein [Holosporales bacterium]OJX04865.1 MAG: hypothetical protein BGO76_07590 [Caedibacter sp. 38-128]